MGLKDICGDIKKKEIVLYGEENQITKFLDSYGTLLKIKYVITDYRNETKLQQYIKWNVQTVMFDDVDLSDKLIVICDKKRFTSLQKRLENVGKKEYVNYISNELVDNLLFGKKILLCMGTQLLGQVSKLLNNCDNIIMKYSVIFFHEEEIMEPYLNRLQEYKHVGRYCDIYVCSSLEKEKFYLKTLKKNVLDPDCRVIKVADYGFGGYFPQIHRDRDSISDYLLRERERLDMSYETLAFSRTDREMETYCKEGMSVEEIVEKLLDINYFTEDRIKDYFAEEVKRFKTMEVSDDIKLGDFIEQHKEDCLCRNLNEWNEPIISYIAETLVDMLELPKLDIDQQTRANLIEDNSGSEFMIYPSVQRALGLQDKLKDKKYKVTTYYSVKHMDLEEYMKYMVTYLYKAMDIMKFTGMDQTLIE